MSVSSIQPPLASQPETFVGGQEEAKLAVGDDAVFLSSSEIRFFLVEQSVGRVGGGCGFVSYSTIYEKREREKKVRDVEVEIRWRYE